MAGLFISLLAVATVFGDAPLIPFVAVTGRPTVAECSRRVEGLAKAGFGGLIVYPRSGLEYEYMGAEWLDIVAAFCSSAELNGLEVWLYDEFNWPSGTCKGRVPQEKSEFRYQEMAFYRNPDGTFRHAVAYGPETWVNPYSFGATKRFIELTHEKYAKRLARWFENKTVRGIFSDEPGSPAKVCLDGPAAVHFRWYDGLDADYRKATGRDLFSDIEAWLATRPATVDNADDKSVWEQAFSGGCEPRTPKTEVFGVLAKLWAMRFRDAYYRPIRTWCEEHGIEFVGHCVGEDHAAGAVRFNGDPLEVLPYETMPGIDEILTRTGPANVDWLVFLTGEYAIRRNGRGGMCELFAVGPCDMPAAKIRQTYYLAALHGITKYFLSMDSIDMRGLVQKNCYLGPFNSAQPWFADCSRLMAEDAQTAARFARLPQVAPSVVLRYPRTLAAMATYARTPDPDDVVRPLLNALCGAQLSVRLVKEDEPAQGPIILSVEGDGLREERSGTVFTTVDEAIAYVRAHVSPLRRFEERDGRWAEALAVREYADAERSLLAVNLDECHARDLVMVDRDGSRRPVTIPPRGVLMWSDREADARPADARSHVLNLGRRFDLSFDRPTLWRVAYGEGCSKAEIFVDERLEGVRLAVRDYPKSVGTVRIDGRVIAADESCTVLPDGFANLYRMSRPFALEPGRHVLSFDGEDRIYFFPAVFLSGDFAVKDGRFLRRPVCGETGSLDALGLGTFVGKVTYSADLAIPLAGASQIAFTTGGHYAEVRLDGRSLGLRGWDPFSFDVPADLRGRTVRAEISLWTSYRPMFGAYDVANAWWRGRVTDYGPVDNLVSTPGYFCGLKPLSGDTTSMSSMCNK